MINIRTVDDLNGEKSKNGGFGVRICVFFSFTCNEIEQWRKTENEKWNEIGEMKGKQNKTHKDVINEQTNWM